MKLIFPHCVEGPQTRTHSANAFRPVRLKFQMRL